MDLTLQLGWTLGGDAADAPIDPVLFAVLGGVREGGHLNHAARAAAVSYRHAWGLVRDWEARFGAPLIIARRGRGAQLTELGEALLDTVAATEQSLRGALEQAALGASARLSEVVDDVQHHLTIACSHGDRITALRDVLGERWEVAVDVAGSETALQRYRRGEAAIAGFHLPLGTLGERVAPLLIRLLDGARDQLWLMEQRTLGLVSRPDRPVTTLAQLAEEGLRFINRQPGAGTRLAFDELLADAGIAAAAVRGYADEEYSHNAVAALVASGSADAGFASAAAAARMHLNFTPFLDERFYLVAAQAADSRLRRAIGEFCAAQAFPEQGGPQPEEMQPTLPVLKRVHSAGFWKT